MEKINQRKLNSIPLDSGQRNYDDDFKLDIYLKITQLQLEAEDSGIILQLICKALFFCRV